MIVELELFSPCSCLKAFIEALVPVKKKPKFVGGHSYLDRLRTLKWPSMYSPSSYVR